MYVGIHKFLKQLERNKTGNRFLAQICRKSRVEEKTIIEEIQQRQLIWRGHVKILDEGWLSKLIMI